MRTFNLGNDFALRERLERMQKPTIKDLGNVEDNGTPQTKAVGGSEGAESHPETEGAKKAHGKAKGEKKQAKAVQV